LRKLPATNIHLPEGGLSDDEEIKAPRVDDSTSPHVENSRKKENIGGKHCKNSKAERRVDSTKGIYYWVVFRFAVTAMARRVSVFALLNLLVLRLLAE
jgi:hypothetical protein